MPSLCFDYGLALLLRRMDGLDSPYRTDPARMEEVDRVRCGAIGKQRIRTLPAELILSLRRWNRQVAAR